MVTESEDTVSEWLEEGKRLIPVMPRLVPHNALCDLADEVATSQSRANALMQPPARTARRKRSSDSGTEVNGKKVCGDGVSVRRKPVPSSPKPVSQVTGATSIAPHSLSSRTKPLIIRQRPAVTKEQIPGPNVRPKVMSRNSAPPAVPMSAPSSATTPTPGRLVLVQNLPYVAQHTKDQAISGPTVKPQNESPQQAVKSVIRLSSATSQRTPNQSSISSASCKPVATVSGTPVVVPRTSQPITSNNYIILPPKQKVVHQLRADGSGVLVPVNNGNRQDTMITADIQNDHFYTTGGTIRSSRPQILTIPCASQANKSPLAAAAARINGASGSQVRTEGMVNLKTIPVTSSVRMSGTSVTTGPTVNRIIRKPTNVIEIQASDEVMQSLQRNGTLSQDLIALVQKAVGMANGSPATLTIRPPITTESQSSSSHNNNSAQPDAPNVPNSAAAAAPSASQPVISAPNTRSLDTKCDAERVPE